MSLSRFENGQHALTGCSLWLHCGGLGILWSVFRGQYVWQGLFGLWQGSVIMIEGICIMAAGVGMAVIGADAAR